MHRIKRGDMRDGFMWLLPMDWLPRASLQVGQCDPWLGSCKGESLMNRGEYCPARTGLQRGWKKAGDPGVWWQEGEQCKMRSRSQGQNHVWILF